jgi:predicted DNA-binding transcriptional regulator AlpA
MKAARRNFGAAPAATSEHHQNPEDDAIPPVRPRPLARAAPRRRERCEKGVAPVRAANADADMPAPAPNAGTRCADVEVARADLLASLPPLLGSEEVAQLAGITSPGLRNRVARGDRPRPISSVARRLRFHRGEVIAWLLGEPE